MADTTENQSPQELREAVDRANARAKAAEDRAEAFQNAALAGLAHRAGFDPNLGVTKLVMEKFAATDLTPDKLDPTAFTEFAKGFDVEPTPTTPTPTETPAPGGEGTPTPTPQQPAAVVPQGQPGAPVPPQLQTQVPQGQAGIPGQPAVPSPVAQMQQFQAPADQLAAVAQPGVAQPTDRATQVAQAEQRGDWNTTIALKMAQSREMFAAGVPVGDGSHPQST